MIFNRIWEIWLILRLQECGEWLGPLMEVFTWMGYPQAYMIIVAIIYWAFDRKLGLRMAVFLPVSASLNSILKQAIHAPRPYWVDKRIIALHPENGFGMPSGHAQSAAVWLLAASYLKRGWFWILAIGLTIGVGISRAFLGVHFPLQIIAGWLIGTVIILCFIRFEPFLLSWFMGLKFIHQILFTMAFTVLFIAAGSMFTALLNGWEMPGDWIGNASEYLSIGKAGLKSYGTASVAGNAGSFMGVVSGALLMMRKGEFSTGGAWWLRTLRILLGLACMALIYAGMQSISPDRTITYLYSFWRFSGFFILSFSAVFLLPLLFLRLKLQKPKGQD